MRSARRDVVLRAAAGAAAVGALLVACVRTVDLGTVEVAQDIREQAVVRSAQNLPAQFTVVELAAVTGDCPRRLTDAGAGTLLDLIRSMMLPVQDTSGSRFQAFGDYTATPRGTYGDSRPGDAVRIDCGRLRAIGIIDTGATGR
jgi:hypothetical protein